MRWQEILTDYDKRHCCDGDRELAWLREQRSLRAAIDVAARAVDRCGKRHSHQRRIRPASLLQATTALLAAENRLARAKSFDELLKVVTDQLRDVFGTGALYCYDTAFRIGVYRELFPTRVHLHAGTRAGARALGLEYRKEALDMGEVPAALRQRKPSEVEDILCIYKDVFRGDALPAAGCAAGARRPTPLHCK